MIIDVFCLLPEVMAPYLEASILGKAQLEGAVQVQLHNIREYTTDKHHTTDDEPYGGGGGMVMKPEPVFRAVERVLGDQLGEFPIVLLTPQGRRFDQELARELSAHPRLALICGRYEGVDERIRQHLASMEISIGDYVLTGGELPALVVIDAVVRCISGVLGHELATERDSYANGLLEGPHYTRPAKYRAWEVPEVLRSGDHARIAAWRRAQALRRTLERRPDLLTSAKLSPQDRELLRSLQEERGG